MKIKKPLKTAEGGVAMADRFKLEPLAAPPKAGGVARKPAMVALIFGLVALVVIGILTFTLYKHWEFLMPA